jgi:hypothetical protein
MARPTRDICAIFFVDSQQDSESHALGDARGGALDGFTLQ